MLDCKGDLVYISIDCTYVAYYKLNFHLIKHSDSNSILL